MSQFLPIGGYNWLYPKYLDQNIYSSNSLKGYASVVGYEYLKLVRESNNDYSSVPDEIEIQKEMLSNYELDNFNKLWLTFLIKKSMCFIMKICNFI